MRLALLALSGACMIAVFGLTALLHSYFPMLSENADAWTVVRIVWLALACAFVLTGYRMRRSKLGSGGEAEKDRR